MADHNLRYFALAAYTGLAALFVALDKIDISDPTIAIAVLSPVAIILGADVIKHRTNTK